MWYPFKKDIELGRFYKSLGLYKTFIEEIEKTDRKGNLELQYKAYYLPKDLRPHQINSGGDVCYFGYNLTGEDIIFNTEDEAKAAIDLYVEKYYTETVSTKKTLTGYP